MIDFVCIFAIIFEIILTVLIVRKFLKLEKKVKMAHDKLILVSNIFFEINKKTGSIILKINKFVSIVTNKKFIRIKNVIKLTISTIQIILLIRSLNLFKTSGTINFSEFKKLIISEGLKRLLKSICTA